MTLPAIKPSLHHKSAVGMVNDMKPFDERRVPKLLGGGIVFCATYVRYELTKNGEVLFVGSRRDMAHYLALRAEGRAPVVTKACRYCGTTFYPACHKQKYCCETCKIEMHKLRMRQRAYPSMREVAS